MNLTTARSESRSREIGIRKVIGSKRKQLIYQFLGESVILSVIAFNFAIIIIILFIPVVNNLLGVQLKLNYSEGIFWIFLCISLFTGLLSGIYPAFVLSNFKPIKVLTGSGLKYSPKGGKKMSGSFRKFLVVTQFFISIIFIICAIVSYKQLNYIKNKDLGFDKEYLIHLKLRGSFYDNYPIIKQELLKNPDISSITITNGGFANNSNGTVIDTWEGKKTDENVFMCIQSVDFDYQNTFKVTMTEGRFFSENYNRQDRLYWTNQYLSSVMPDARWRSFQHIFRTAFSFRFPVQQAAAGSGSSYTLYSSGSPGPRPFFTMGTGPSSGL